MAPGQTPAVPSHWPKSSVVDGVLSFIAQGRGGSWVVVGHLPQRTELVISGSCVMRFQFGLRTRWFGLAPRIRFVEPKTKTGKTRHLWAQMRDKALRCFEFHTLHCASRLGTAAPGTHQVSSSKWHLSHKLSSVIELPIPRYTQLHSFTQLAASRRCASCISSWLVMAITPKTNFRGLGVK